MNKFLLAAATTLAVAQATESLPSANSPFGLVIHGGAGVIVREKLSPELEAEYRAKLAEARDAGYAVLERGGSAVDAVVATITILEDSPLFNAGKGAVFNHDGICELDASIMDGRTLAAGAIAGVHHVRNPIQLARAVMEKSEHVMLTGDGAETFAKQLGFELVPNEYFHTELRRQQLEQVKKKAATPSKTSAGMPSPQPSTIAASAGVPETLLSTVTEPALARRTTAAAVPIAEEKHGTVGCVALDRSGNLAAGTSTGGMTNKRFGRIGDSPIIGAGTYAGNATCAVSATGWGEYFIRIGVARDIAAQMEYKQATLADAAAATIAKVGQLGGDGGVICIDRTGTIAMPFNTAGMYRGYRLSTGKSAIEIFGPVARNRE